MNTLKLLVFNIFMITLFISCNQNKDDKGMIVDERKKVEIVEEEEEIRVDDIDMGVMTPFFFIEKYIEYPENAKNKMISGKVSVTFVVKKNGSVSNVEIIQGADVELDNEVIRVIKLIPKTSRTNLNTHYSLSVRFKI